MLVVHHADDPFVCFGVKTDKGFGLEISRRLEVGRGTPVRVGQRNGEKQLAKGDASRNRTAEVTSRHERESSSSEGGPVKMRQHSSWVVEFLLEIHASVSLHMHIGNAMLHNSSSYTLS